MCPGARATSICASLFLSRKCVAASTNVCDVRWLDPGFSLVIAETEDVLAANSTTLPYILFSCGVACWNAIAVSSPLKSPIISAS